MCKSYLQVLQQTAARQNFHVSRVLQGRAHQDVRADATRVHGRHLRAVGYVARAQADAHALRLAHDRADELHRVAADVVVVTVATGLRAEGCVEIVIFIHTI